MKKMKKFSLLVTTVVLFMALSMTSTAAARISKKSITLVKGQTAVLKISGTTKNVKWSSGKKSVATVTRTGKVAAKKKGTATITAKIGRKKYTCKVTVKDRLTAKQAEKAVKNYLLKKNFRFYYNPAVKEGKSYVIWVTYTQTGMKSKYVVNSVTGVTRSYAPYFGIDMPAVVSVSMEYKFNAYDFLK